MWSICLFVGHISFSSPPCSAKDPVYGKGYVANPPICRLLLILSPALKLWGSSNRQALCDYMICVRGAEPFRAGEKTNSGPRVG